MYLNIQSATNTDFRLVSIYVSIAVCKNLNHLKLNAKRCLPNHM